MEKIKFILPVLILLSIAVYCPRDKKYYKDKKDSTKYEDVDPVDAVDVTIDGYEPSADTTYQKLNIWRTYEKRSYSGTVSHGEEVKMLLRRDDLVLIKKSDETNGWIEERFVKEVE